MIHAGGATRTAFFSHGGRLSNSRRDYVATITWKAHGRPYVG